MARRLRQEGGEVGLLPEREAEARRSVLADGSVGGGLESRAQATQCRREESLPPVDGHVGDPPPGVPANRGGEHEPGFGVPDQLDQIVPEQEPLVRRAFLPEEGRDQIREESGRKVAQPEEDLGGGRVLLDQWGDAQVQAADQALRAQLLVRRRGHVGISQQLIREDGRIAFAVELAAQGGEGESPAGLAGDQHQGQRMAVERLHESRQLGRGELLRREAAHGGGAEEVQVQRWRETADLDLDLRAAVDVAEPAAAGEEEPDAAAEAEKLATEGLERQPGGSDQVLGVVKHQEDALVTDHRGKRIESFRIPRGEGQREPAGDLVDAAHPGQRQPEGAGRPERPVLQHRLGDGERHLGLAGAGETEEGDETAGAEGGQARSHLRRPVLEVAGPFRRAFDSGRPRRGLPALRADRLRAGDPPDQALDAFVGQPGAEIHPGVFAEKEPEVRLVGCSGEEDRDHRLAFIEELVQEGPDLGFLPVSEAVRPHEHRGRAGRLHGRFEAVLEGKAGPELIGVEPGVEAVGLQACLDLADERPVLAIVAQEDVEGRGHGGRVSGEA